MTDEAMADKYAFENRESCMYDDRIGWETDHVARKRAFLAGIEAGRSKWHKVADGDLPNEKVKLILVRDRWKNRFLNYHLLLNKMIVEMIDQFDEWVELPIEE